MRVSGSTPSGIGSGSPPSTSTTRSTRSGRRDANTTPTKPPMDSPTTVTGPVPRWSSTVAQSAAWAAMPNGPGSSLLPPRPRRSGAIRVNSSPRWRATGTSDIDDAVTPCTPRTTRRPAPHRPTRSAPPATGTSTNSNPSPAPLIDASGVMSEVLLAGLDLLPPGGAVAVRRLHHVELERAELALAAGEVDGAQRVLLELVAGEEHARELVAGAVLAAVEEDLVECPERQPHLPV